jgi:chromosome segregation ATPase
VDYSVFPEISADEERMLSKLATKIRIKTEIDAINLKLEELQVKQEIEGLNLSEEQHRLEQRKTTLQEELQGITDSFPVLKLKEEISMHTIRLEKLEQKRGSISEKVYSSLSKEYSQSLADLQIKLEKEERRIRELHHQLKLFLDTLDETIEELQIRGELEGASRNFVDSKIKELENQKLRATDLIKAVEQILG